MIAHEIHYAVLGIGLIGLLALLGPQLAPGTRTRIAYDDHDRRVAALTEQLTGATVLAAPRPAVIGVRSSWLPVAIVSSAAAAGVHAAVGPEHFGEQLLFGLFFAGSALAQVGWSMAMVARPTRTLLVAAALGNAAVLVLWAVTRTVGLPVLLPHPEAVGPWDLCCGAWELVVVLACARLLREGREPAALRLPSWESWQSSAQAWAVGSVLLLGTLALAGGGS